MCGCATCLRLPDRREALLCWEVWLCVAAPRDYVCWSVVKRRVDKPEAVVATSLARRQAGGGCRHLAGAKTGWEALSPPYHLRSQILLRLRHLRRLFSEAIFSCRWLVPFPKILGTFQARPLACRQNFQWRFFAI